MSQINYANATFNKVVLEGSDFKDKEAVTASYVNAKIDDLVNGASTSFDTLKELSVTLSNGEDVAVAVTSQISSLGLSLNSESNARVAHETAKRFYHSRCSKQRIIVVNICGYNCDYATSSPVILREHASI